MVQNTPAKGETYGIRNPADYKGKLLTSTMEGFELEINGTIAWFPLVGEFNAYNILVSYAVAGLLGMALKVALVFIVVYFIIQIFQNNKKKED